MCLGATGQIAHHVCLQAVRCGGSVLAMTGGSGVAVAGGLAAAAARGAAGGGPALRFVVRVPLAAAFDARPSLSS
jgi:hypothetical protein